MARPELDAAIRDTSLAVPQLSPRTSPRRGTERLEHQPQIQKSVTAPAPGRKTVSSPSPSRDEQEPQHPLARRSLTGTEKPKRAGTPGPQGESKKNNIALLRNVVKAQAAASTMKGMQEDTEEKKREHEEKKRKEKEKVPDPTMPTMFAKGNLFLGEELMHLPLFQCCSAKLVNDITSLAQTQSYGPGVTLVEQGSVGSSLILVLRGTLNLIVDGFKVQRLINGQYFGETIMIGIEDHWRAKLRSESAITLCEIPREAFYKALSHHPSEKRYFDNLREKHRNVEYLWAGTLEHTVELFKGLSERLRRCIDTLLVRRIYFPTEKILTEGLPGDELFLLVRGKASIDIAGRTVRIERRDSGSHLDHPPGHPSDDEDAEDGLSNMHRVAEQVSPRQSPPPTSPLARDESGQHVTSTPVCFGELGLLGLQSVRSASVTAQTICQIRVLYRETFLKSLEEHGESLQSMASFFQKRYKTSMTGNSQKLSEVAIFQEVGCSKDFLNFLAQHLEDRMYLQGQTIIDETLPDDRCMYLISSGTVNVIKGGAQVAQLGAGSVVGEITVLGLASKRSSTVIAAETCYTQVLHQSIVVRGLELFPDERQKVLMMAFKQAGLDDGDGLPAGENSDGKMSGRLLNQGGTHRAFMKVLKASPLFASTSSAFVEEISNAAIDRIYMPQDLIIEQGLKGDSMFIMVSGQAGVFVTEGEIQPSYQGDDPSGRTEEVQTNKIKDWERVRMSRVGTLHAGSISGELAMLGVSTIRSATIEAETICSMWEITQEKALAILDRFPDAQKHFSDLIVKHLQRTVPGRILALPLFKGFDRKFRTLLGLYCERTVKFPGQYIAREGQTGQDMGNPLYIINMGRASLEKKGVAIKTYSSGYHFGSTVMLGIHKVYLGTLIVIQTCHVLIVTRAHYLQALDHYPSQHSSNELKRSEKLATEELKKAIQRISARKLIWKRYQGMINPDASENSEKAITSAELLAKAFGGWRQAVVDMTTRRRRRDRELTRYRQMMDGWVTKKREARERAKEKQLADWRLQNEALPWVGSDRPDSRRTPRTPLPLEPVKVASVTPDSAQLIDLLKEWPTPRPSPFYNLRVWDVLAEHIDSPGQDSTILPLLAAPPNSAETTQEGPLCTTPSRPDGYKSSLRQSINFRQSISSGYTKHRPSFARGATDPVHRSTLSDSGSSSDEQDAETHDQLLSNSRPESHIRRAVGSFSHLADEHPDQYSSPVSSAARSGRKSVVSKKSTNEFIVPRNSTSEFSRGSVTPLRFQHQDSIASGQSAVAKAEALQMEVSPPLAVIESPRVQTARKFRRAKTYANGT